MPAPLASPLNSPEALLNHFEVVHPGSASVLLAIERNVSSPAVNSSKRLNNDVAALFQQRPSRSLGHTI